ncbi:MAG: HAMP domain-containing protein [Planctomycetes bacterium]|nr:HAMP domain-containing protein [Planctomycetota bacterium]
MRLRTRLALTLGAIAVPLVGSAVWLRNDLAQRAAIQSLVEYARLRMTTGGREMCESAPMQFQEPPPGPRGGEPRPPPWMRPGGESLDPLDPPPPEDGLDPRAERRRREFERRAQAEASGARRPPARVELWAYGPDFLSANPRAEPFPPELRSRLEAGANEAGLVRASDDVVTTTAVARMSWNSGPCAIVLVRRFDPNSSDALWIDVLGGGALVLLLVGAVALAVGPILRRLGQLEQGVRASASGGYQQGVPLTGSDEITDLATAFNTAGTEVRRQIEAVETRERGLRNFVENTTHDVMLPLTVLQGHLTRLRNDLSKDVMPERETVREALEESHYLASLVQNLGAASKLEGGEPLARRDPFVWNALVDRVILRHKTIAAEKGVELDFAVPEGAVRATGDVTLIEQAVSNVVHNAVRYNRAGGHVAVVLEARDERFVVRVFDDGPGVAPEELTRIRERSYRSDLARARHPDGLGLGLAIATDVCARHGFDLELKASDAGGLEVVFRGPLAV